MFGFSLTKLLVLAAIIGAIWYGFKWVGRLDKMRKEALRHDSRSRESANLAAEEMVRCSSCDTYVAATGARACGRDDCPYAV